MNAVIILKIHNSESVSLSSGSKRWHIHSLIVQPQFVQLLYSKIQDKFFISMISFASYRVWIPILNIIYTQYTPSNFAVWSERWHIYSLIVYTMYGWYNYCMYSKIQVKSFNTSISFVSYRVWMPILYFIYPMDHLFHRLAKLNIHKYWISTILYWMHCIPISIAYI